MTSPLLSGDFDAVADADMVARAGEGLRSRGFDVELFTTVADARAAVAQQLPADRTILTTASETLRLSGIGADVDESGRYRAIRPQLTKLDFRADADERRRLGSGPDIAIGSVQAVTEDGLVVIASASGSQIAAYTGAGKTIWIIGAQKIVSDLETALRRVNEYCKPLEDVRAQQAYGQPSFVAKVLIVERELIQGRSTVMLVNESIGF